MAKRTELPTDIAAQAEPSRRNVLRGVATIGAGATLAAVSADSAPGQSVEPSRVLQGQTAMVTGAARGIGRAISLAYAEAGADVALVDIADPSVYREVLGYDLGSEAELDETATLVEKAGRRAIKIKADIADPAKMESAVAEALDRFGKLDILVANAGVAAGAALSDMPRERWKTVIEINLNGTANALMAALPHMLERKSGRIIIVSSVVGRKGSINSANYVASKWGLIGLTKSAAIEAGPHGITVNAIAPTAVKTGIFGGLEKNAQWLAGFEKVLDQLHPLPVGMLEPEDIAGSAVFLASPAARYITGAVIDVAAGTNAHYTA